MTDTIDKNPVVSTNYIGRGLQMLRSISRNKELSESELTLHCPTPEKFLDIFLLLSFFKLKKLF